ncbi:DUF4438 domain-containing protein [candidate division KSB1 bacterium]
MKMQFLTFILCLFFSFILMDIDPASGQTISTNKDRLVTLAVQGQIAPAQISGSYTTTWNGEPKMAIGTGSINYNLRIGEYVFGWANGDRATVGVSTVGVGDGDFSAAWLQYTAVGNEVRIINGEGKGEKGIVVGRFGSYVQIHFENYILDKLEIGNIVQAKTRGTGLKINGFDDVLIHGIDPDVLDKMDIKVKNGKLEVPVVKEIPPEIMGQGPGRSSLSGNWHIQTCYAPDIEKYGLNELKFGDLVLLKDTQTDYGMGYFIGGATIGIICSGPSDVSGLGIGVTPILSTSFGKIISRIDPSANIGKYLGINLTTSGNIPKVTASFTPSKTPTSKNPGVLKTNKDNLITTAVQGVVQPARSRGYRTTYTGAPKLGIGMASINYSVSMGDLAYGWANADHVEPDVTIQGRDQSSPSACALAILACIGNEAKVVSGDASGSLGIFVGRHAGSDDLVWFPKEVMERLALNDKIQIKAQGVGMKIEGFEDVRINKVSPDLLENLGIRIEGDQLVVPIVLAVPGHIMGSGIGGSFLENVDYDIQTTCPEVVEKYDLKKLRLGDLVAITDHYDFYGRGRYEGAVTVGVIIHGWSDYAGHGPGVNPILSALPGRIKTVIDPESNIVYPLGIKSK